jgi:ferric-dicitrate binding protein FerR (iron transport regulator)
MKNNYPHNDTNKGNDHDNFLEKAKVPYEKSKEEVWDALESKLGDKPAGRVVQFRPRGWVAVSAAILLLLAGTFLVLRFYSVSLKTAPGELLAYTLPDGSTVNLNAGSSINFHPFWWRYERKIRFEGEGYFQVEKGEKFSVKSDIGTTSVLGTRFTVYSRQKEYRVTCLSGAVKVVSNTDKEVILGPEYRAEVNPDGFIVVSKEKSPEIIHSWIDGMFSFTGRSLRLVFDEIERQFNVTVEFQTDEEYLFTGYFSREKPVEEVIELVCKPFGLNFARRSEMAYEVFPN